MDSKEVVSEDLEIITGIGPDVRNWLAETFDVHTFSSLAELSEEDLTDRIKADNKPSIWLRWVKNWPTEAAIKAAEIESETENSKSVRVSNMQKKDLSLPKRSPELSQKPNRFITDQNGWDTLALYFIEFQSREVPGKPVDIKTKVVFEGPGQQVQETFHGFEQERTFQWIFTHARDILGVIPEKGAKITAEEKDQEIASSPISVSRFNLFQPTGVGLPLLSFSSERPQLSMITANQPLDIEVILEGSRLRKSKNGQTNFKVHFNAKNLDTNEYISLGKAEPEMLSDQLGFSALLPNIILHQGMYRLYVLVLTHPKLELLDSIEIPFLNVY